MMERLHFRPRLSDMNDAVYVGHLHGGSLCLRLTVEASQLCCREDRSQLRVPILSRLPPVSDVPACRALLAVCAPSFQVRKGLRLTVPALGGGVGASRKDFSPVAIARKSPYQENGASRHSNIHHLPDFVERREETEKASRVLRERRCVVLMGPAGVGKSTLSDSIAEANPAFRIRWKCDAERRELLISSLRSLAAVLGREPFDFFRLCLNLKNLDALLIVDNLEEHLEELDELKHCASLIITTQNAHWLSEYNPIEVKGLSPPAALDFLVKLSGRQGEREDLQQLCEYLSYFPLGLRNAGMYLRIHQTESVQGVLQALRESPAELVDVMGNSKELASMLKACIEKAVQVSGVRTLLQVAAVMSPEGIPEALYKAVFEAVDHANLLIALAKAKEYSLISVQSDNTILMHRFVQIMVLHICGDATDVRREAISQMYALFKANDWSPENSALFLPVNSWTSSLLAVAERPLVREIELVAKALAYRCMTGERQTLQSSVERCEEWMGQGQDVDTDACLHLAYCFRNLEGGLDKALHWVETAQRQYANAADRSNIKQALIFNALAMVYRSKANATQSSWEKDKLRQLAIEHQTKAVSLLEDSSESRNELAQAYNNLAHIYWDQGGRDKLQLALDNENKAKEIWCELYEPNHPYHPNLGMAYNLLSVINLELGNLDEARALQEKATQFREKLKSTIHPDLADSYYNYAFIQKERGDLASALEFVEKAIKIREELYNDPGDTKRVRSNKLKAEIEEEIRKRQASDIASGQLA